jgi:putative SOS response-associated peptidase YedK
MCYSAMVEQDLRQLSLRLKARIDYALVESLFRRRAEGEPLSIPRAVERALAEGDGESAARLREAAARHREARVKEAEEELLAQRRRQAEAERKLAARPTKNAEKERDSAGRRIERLKETLARLSSDKLDESDARFFPFEWVPVVVSEGGERMVRLMRYHLRPAREDEEFDRKFSGCYNARRDNLEGNFWRPIFGRRHGLIVLRKFFENVPEHLFRREPLAPGAKPRNVVLSFRPRGVANLLVPVIWDEWSRPGKPPLSSFAIITDDPPPEILAAGHSRCPIFLKDGHADAWLNPEGRAREELYRILRDRETPFYEHERVA